MKDYQIEEWRIIVDKALEEITGKCPLVVDETIIAVDEHINQQAAEIERLREDRDSHQRVCMQAMEDLGELKQERDQLKARVTELYLLLDEHFIEWEKDSGEWDEAEWHDRASIALAREGEILAAHEAEVLERVADLFCGLGTLYESKIKAILCEHGDQLRSSANEQQQ